MKTVRSKIITLPETEDGRKWMAAMDSIMRGTQKAAFSEGCICQTIREISAIEDPDRPMDEMTGKPVRTAANLSKITIMDTEIYTLEPEENTGAVLLYLYGGAYLYGLGKEQVEFCDELAVKTGAEVVLPVYKRIPKHHCEETMIMLTAVYREILMEGKPVIFAGDSSGGGLALGFLHHCRASNLPMPAGMILISPWLDVTLSGKKTEELEAKDMMLACDGLRTCGKIWAGNLDPKDPRVSPIFGDLDDLPEMLLFAGTEELLFYDIRELYDRIKNKTKVTLVIGEGMPHDFPLLAAETQQGRRAREMMTVFVENVKNNDQLAMCNVQ